MRMPGIIAIGFALLALPACMTNGKEPARDAAFDSAVARLRTAFERDKQMPLEPDLYAVNLHVSHNYEPGRTVEVPVFLSGVTRELAAAKQVGATHHAEVTRFLVADDTVVVTLLTTGVLRDGTATRFYIAYFFKIKDGRVVDLETWYDRKGAEAQTQAISSELKGQNGTVKAAR
jgi:hypothetical protein